MQTTDRTGLLLKIAELSPEDFEETALAVFRYQAAYNPLYSRYLQLLGRKPALVKTTPEIPFLPITLFKKYTVQTGRWAPQAVFTSSGTTGQIPSHHAVRDLEFYLENTRRGFSRFYGAPSDWCFLALLPAYLERQGSSLVAMADFFIRKSRYPESGFFLNDFEKLAAVLQACRQNFVPTIVLGVSFALLDFAEQYPMDLSGVVVMETGGMKGRRREMTRAELHQTLGQAFHLSGIHSEYGMTELFSQAYCQPKSSDTGLLFEPAPTLRAVATELNDPFCTAAPGRPGILQFIDLANIDTCSFIATEDLGKVYPDGRFEVLGRSDAAEMRGCNLMVE